MFVQLLTLQQGSCLEKVHYSGRLTSMIYRANVNINETQGSPIPDLLKEM